jgi:hypothetical protein
MTYCQSIDRTFLESIEARRPRSLEALNRLWYGFQNTSPGHYHHSRYRGLNLHSLWYRGTCEFRYFNSTLHAGKIKAYIQFVLALAAKALSARAASSKRREFNPATAKYDFRVFLLNLGLIGEEFKTARLHLTERLQGSAAWKHGRRDRPRTAAAPGSAPAGEPGVAMAAM